MLPLDDLKPAVRQARDWLGDIQPETALILGSGLASLTEHLEGGRSIPWSQLAGFPAPGAQGHGGCLYSGSWVEDRPVLVFAGRYHYYEGYSAWQVTAPVRLAHQLGCRRVLLTNAAGGVDPDLQAGDFMLVRDHLNLSGINPLRGREEQTFIDLQQLYAEQFHPGLAEDLSRQGIRLHSGILAWMPGPSYETPAEVRALAALGAAAVSMSTIPEAIVARWCGLEVAALSLIANPAAGRGGQPLNHQDVLSRGNQAAPAAYRVITQLLRRWN